MFNYKKEANAHCIENDIDKSTIEVWKHVDPIEHCLHSVKVFIQGVLEAVKADSYQIYLTGKGNFREEVATILPYKGNRSGDKPTYYPEITEYLLGRWNAEMIEGMEADDAMAIEQYKWNCFADKANIQMKLEGGTIDPVYNTVICTIDKDLMMVPGNHYNWNKKLHSFVTEEEGSKFFYTQLITGDATDNIQGIPGAGPAAAKKILKGCSTEREMYVAVRGAYLASVAKEYVEEPHISPEDLQRIADARLLENAYLLWMCLSLDEDGNPVMWKPPEREETISG